MLKTIDQALAGAIDVIADDVQATVKSVREQGVMRTLGDAVEDAAGLVKSGAGAVLHGVVGAKKGPEKISNHAGVSSSYADLCAGPGSRSMGGGNGAVFPYTPPPNAGKPGAKQAVPKFSAGGFAPGIGIQRANTAPFPTQGGVQVFAKAPAAQTAFVGAAAGNLRSYAGPAPPAGGYAATGYPAAGTHLAPAPSAPSSIPGGKEPPLPAGVLAARFEEIKKRDPANDKCFDCGAHNPEWASVSFGVFLCIECGGHHRNMGTHISRIRSCKMDSWTERQLQIFDHSGNRHLGAFFAANGVGNAVRFQRYHTPAAEWYREAWIKNRIFDRAVPAPPQGLVVGPCIDKKAEAKAKEQVANTAPPADLLDFGGDPPAATVPAASQPAAQADLLGFGDTPAAGALAGTANADLTGVAASALSAPSSSGDLLGLGGCGVGQATSAGLLLDLAATAQAAHPPIAALASSDFASLESMSTPAAPPPAVTPTLQAPAAGLVGSVCLMPPSLQQPWGGALTSTSPAAAVQTPSGAAAANTLAGGAKLAVDAPKDEKASDPFAMALEKWGM